MGGKTAGTIAFVFVGLVLLKDGTLGTVFNNAAKTGESFIKGIKPLSSIG
jgi:hypothetical protein